MKKLKIKSKNNLITEVKNGLDKPTRLIKKILREVKLAQKNPPNWSRNDWESLEENLKVIIDRWQKRQSEKIVEQFLTELKLALRENQSVVLRGHFSLKVRRSAERKARNPQTGEQMLIKEQNRLSFRASAKWKREIN